MCAALLSTENKLFQLLLYVKKTEPVMSVQLDKMTIFTVAVEYSTSEDMKE